MEILNIADIDENVLQILLLEKEGGKNAFSLLATSQTGNDRTVPEERIQYIKNSHDHIMLVVLEDNTLVGMALGQRVTGIANVYMYVHDIVIDPNLRGGGVGSVLMQRLLDDGLTKWPEVVRIQLTSRPSRGTGPFFQKFGFRARTKDSGDETIVYVKDIGDYTS